MPNTIGNFYFKLTDAGNLIGEYSNEKTPRSRPESALRDFQDQGTDFLGEYFSTWFEPGEKTENAGRDGAKLKIERKNDEKIPRRNLFELTWAGLDGGPVRFRGEAMLSDGMLIGNYWSATT